MLPVSVSDITKILDSIPVWKSLLSLPKRLAELEARVKALESGQAQHAGPTPNECPTCGAVMPLIAERDDPTFGRVGLKQHVFRCDNCGGERTRQWSPEKGYR